MKQVINVGLALLLLQQLLFAVEPFGMALQVKGEVLVTRDILEFEAQVEEVFMWDDEIETGADGSLILVFDSSFLSVGPNTLMHFDRRKGSDGEDLMVMVLEKGSFRSKILNLGSRQFFEVESEAGRLRVHGTDFVTSFDSEGSEGFGVAVLQGRVAVSPATSEEGSTNSSELSSESAVAAPMMLTQNKSGGFSGGGVQKAVEPMSFAQVDGLKEAMPVPGDESGSLVMEDFGLKNVAVESLVENIKEDVIPPGGEAPPEVNSSERILQVEFSIVDS